MAALIACGDAVNEPPNINVVELNPAIQSLKETLSCSSCHQVVVKDLQIHLCCGGAGRYCRPCSHDLSHCLACDEALVSPMKSLDEILAATSGATSQPSTGRLLSLLQEIVVHHQNDMPGGEGAEAKRRTAQIDPNQSCADALNLKRPLRSPVNKRKRMFRDVQNLTTSGAAVTDRFEESPKKSKNAPAETNPRTLSALPSRSQTRKSSNFPQHNETADDKCLQRGQGTQLDTSTLSTMFPSTSISENRLQSMANTMPCTMPSTHDLARRLDEAASIAVASGNVEESSPSLSIALEQCSSTPFGSLPDTMDFARHLSGTKSSTPLGSGVDSAPMISEERKVQTSTSLTDVSRRREVVCDDEFRPKISPRLTSDSSSYSALPVDSLPSTLDFVRKLPITQYGVSLHNRVPVVVAVETLTREQAKLCRRKEGQILFVQRICRSTMDLDDCVVLPSHFLATSSDAKARTCARTYEYLKAMALGLCIVGSSWIEDQDDTKNGMWGDSQLAQRATEVMNGNDESPYSWLADADWWGTSQGPCWSASRRAQNAGQLLERLLVRILPSCVTSSTPSLLDEGQAELLCLLTGATCIMSLDEDRSAFEGDADEDKRLLLVPDGVSRDAITQLLACTHAGLPQGATVENGTKWRGKREAIILTESWLIDSISAQVVAPLPAYAVGVLRW
jgi:hypothetical protein